MGALNSHMEAKHGVENFDQMLKRSFKPDISPENMARKMPKKKIKRDPIKRDLSNLTQDVWQEDYNNNIIEIEENVEDSKTNIEIVKIEDNVEDSKKNIKYE